MRRSFPTQHNTTRNRTLQLPTNTFFPWTPRLLLPTKQHTNATDSSSFIERRISVCRGKWRSFRRDRNSTTVMISITTTETASGGQKYVPPVNIDASSSCLVTDPLVGRTNRQMVRLLWTVHPLHGIYDRWLLACEEENQQGPRASEIPSSTFLFPLAGMQDRILTVHSGFLADGIEPDTIRPTRAQLSTTTNTLHSSRTASTECTQCHPLSTTTPTSHPHTNHLREPQKSTRHNGVPSQLADQQILLPSLPLPTKLLQDLLQQPSRQITPEQVPSATIHTGHEGCEEGVWA